MARSKADREALSFARRVVTVGRDTPELLAALNWIVGTRDPMADSLFKVRPPLEELAAAIRMGGPAVASMLRSTSYGRRLAGKLPDLSEKSLMVIRASAAQRVGFGVESLIQLKTLKPSPASLGALLETLVRAWVREELARFQARDSSEGHTDEP